MVALKVLRPGVAEQGTLEAIKEELRIARRITHRNVLRTHDFGEAEGMAFISMEFVRGMTLRELLDHTARLPLSVALRLSRQLLAGVEAAHRMGVVHRDLRPENLILDSSGVLRIMDFGIARAARISRAPGERTAVVGTPGYLAPEQLDGHPGDVRSDLYACGVVLYEMISGVRPFTAFDANELWYRVQNEDPVPLAQVAPEIPADIAQIVMRALERDPARRFASATEMLEALGKVEA
jgi:serine/threonine-protein kinase